MEPPSAIPILAIPGAVWIVSYLVLVREFGRWNLINERIHESGTYTLVETVFYYRHFLRELPIDTLFAMAILWSYSAAGLRVPAWPSAPLWAFALLGAFMVFVTIGSLRSVGPRLTLEELGQMRETDHRVGWGTHWQMHFLSTAVLLLLLMLPGVLSAGASSVAAQGLGLIAAFLVLSVTFRCGLRSLTHTRWILHGAREVFTYGLIIALPAFWLLLSAPALRGMRANLWGGAIFLSLVGAAFYFIHVYRKSDLDQEAASDRGLAFLAASHFFEHVLDFLYILLLIVAAGAL